MQVQTRAPHTSLNADPDAVHLWQAMKEPDADKFREAMQIEIDDRMKGGHWIVVPKDTVPKSCTILPAVWQMKWKRCISTREVYKWKARINIDGSKQIYGLHYDEMYTPVVTWPTVWYFLIQALIKGRRTKQLDFVLAYTQADVERDLYMEIPKGIHIADVPREHQLKYVLKLIRTCMVRSKLSECGTSTWSITLKSWGSLRVCVFYFKRSVFLVYTE